MPDEFMTCVFPMDVRDYHGNPHQAMTPFGQAQIVSRGNLAAERDALEEQIDALVEALEGMVRFVEATQESDLCSFYQANNAETFLDNARTAIAKARGIDTTEGP